MSQNRSKGIVGIFILISSLFVIFLLFAFYTVASLQRESDTHLSNKLDGKRGPIAVVEVDGVIMDSEDTIKKLLIAEQDDKIKAIIVRINSPGGAVGPTQEVYEEIRRIDETKPVYSSFGSVAASGGYYIGAATRKIYSNAGTLTGSIGVIMNFLDLSELYQWAKVSPETVKSGRYKDVGSPARKMSADERRLLTEMTQEVHDQFIDDIFSVREKLIKGGRNALLEYAQGQIFSGNRAMEVGLVDEIAGLWEAGRRIHKELEIEGDFGLKFIKLKKDISFIDMLSGIEGAAKKFGGEMTNQNAPMYLFKP